MYEKALKTRFSLRIKVDSGSNIADSSIDSLDVTVDFGETSS